MTTGYEYTITAVGGPWSEVLDRIHEHTLTGGWRLHRLELIEGLSGTKLLVFERTIDSTTPREPAPSLAATSS